MVTAALQLTPSEQPPVGIVAELVRYVPRKRRMARRMVCISRKMSVLSLVRLE